MPALERVDSDYEFLPNQISEVESVPDVELIPMEPEIQTGNRSQSQSRSRSSFTTSFDFSGNSSGTRQTPVMSNNLGQAQSLADQVLIIPYESYL